MIIRTNLTIICIFASLSVWANDDHINSTCKHDFRKQMPFELTVDAGMNAEKLIAKGFHMHFLESYYKGAFEYAALGKEVSDEIDVARKACKSTVDPQAKALTCGYYYGASFTKSNTNEINLAVFGYTKFNFTGVIRVDDKGLFYIKPPEEGLIIISTVSNIFPQISQSGHYHLSGYLSPKGKYGPAGTRYEREFVVQNATLKSDSQSK